MLYLQCSMRRAAALAAFLSVGEMAQAATWANGRSSPALAEITAVDATGETAWPYGAEDVAGDGIATFNPAEQSFDIRTTYSATDPQRFWTRVYVSDTQPAGGNVRAFVFIDADRNASTGGTGAAPEIDPKFSTDASPGGYEFVLEVGGSGATVRLWTWQRNQYTVAPLQPARATGEAGADVDPIRIGAPAHGYLQASVELRLVGVTEACDANLYVRSVNDTPSLGAGDLEVGQLGTCVAADANGNGVPDVLVPKTGCTSDAQCAGGGICQAGQCVLATPCVANGGCGAGMQCTTDGRCVPVPGGTCVAASNCNGLVCQGGRCVACTPGGSPCVAGQVCSPDGHCIADQGAGDRGLQLGPDESVKGGACHCDLSRRTDSGHAPALLAGTIALFLSRRRVRRSR